MRPAYHLLALTVAGGLAFAETPVKPEDAAKFKTYDLAELSAMMPEAEGNIVKLKFTYRGSQVERQEDGSLRSTLSYMDRGYQSGTIPVLVPKEAAPWFLKLTYEQTSRQRFVVFAKIAKTESGTVAELLGRELRTDNKGPKIVW